MEIEFMNSSPIFVPKEEMGGNVRGVGSTEQSASTYMIVPSGETRVIGGLISRDLSDSTDGVPYLSRLPILGFLFGQMSNKDTLTNLMFFITPTIIQESPLNDLVVEPVNEVAKLGMEEAKKEEEAPENPNEIPTTLKPYLEEIRPEALPMPDDQASTMTSSVRLEAPDLGTTASMTLETKELGGKLLKNEPYKSPQPAVAQLKVGGALGATGGAKGPTGTFGGGGGVSKPKTKAAVRKPEPVAPKPTPTPTRQRDRRSRRGGMPGSETRY
jgi:hypothetical protein